jgi:hypothetical protein
MKGLVIGLFFFMLSVISIAQQPLRDLDQKKTTNNRLYGGVRLGNKALLPWLGYQHHIKKNSFFNVGFGFGNGGSVWEEVFYRQNADGSYSPSQELDWMTDPFDSTSTTPPGTPDNLSLNLDFKVFTALAQYQMLLIGYVKKKHRLMCYFGIGPSFSFVNQSGYADYFFAGNSVRADYPVKFRSLSIDMEPVISYEYKQVGFRTGFRMRFGFPLYDGKIVYGTSTGNLYSGFNTDVFVGFSYRF